MNLGTKWNRSSAFSCDELAALTAITNNAVEHAVQIFERGLQKANLHLTDEQRRDVYPTLTNGVTEGIAKYVESLKQ